MMEILGVQSDFSFKVLLHMGLMRTGANFIIHHMSRKRTRGKVNGSGGGNPHNRCAVLYCPWMFK